MAEGLRTPLSALSRVATSSWTGGSQLRPSLQSCSPHPSVHPACSPGRLQTGAGKANAGIEPKPHAHSAALTPARCPSSVRFVLCSLPPWPWSSLLLLVPCPLPSGLIVTQDRLRGPSFPRLTGFMPWFLPSTAWVTLPKSLHLWASVSRWVKWRE